MQRSLKQNLAVGGAVAALLLGGAIAAVSATGQGNGHAASAHAGAHRGRELTTAAGYLGISTDQLRSELRSGKTLASLANSTSGKSAEGLVDVLVAARKARLADVEANLTQRVTAEVNRAGGPRLDPRGLGARSGTGGAHPRNLFANPGQLGFAAASYLGVTAAQLKAELGSGKTLAQVADATPGKSKEGLVKALVSAKKTKLAAFVAAGRINPSKEQRLLKNIDRRLTHVVTRPSLAGAPR